MTNNNQKKKNLLRSLLNTRKRSILPKGTASLNEVRKLIKDAPLAPEEALNQLKRLGFAGGKRRTRRTRRLR